MLATSHAANAPAAGDACLARRPGLRSRPERAVVERVLVKGFLIRMEADGEQLKVARVEPLKPERRAASAPSPAQRPTLTKMVAAWNADPARAPIVRASAVPPPAAPQPKPEAPERCPEWLAMIRKLPCCNCGARPPCDPHHEGPRGVGQKCRDTRTAPLCRRCHQIYTDTNCLPRPPEHGGGLLSRDASLSILHGAMLRVFGRVLRALDAERQVELMSAALARMDQAALMQTLRAVNDHERRGL